MHYTIYVKKRTEFEPSQFGSSREQRKAEQRTESPGRNRKLTKTPQAENSGWRKLLRPKSLDETSSGRSLSISYRFSDIWFQRFQGLTLTLKGHLRSKIFLPFESPYMTSYLTSIDTFSLSQTVFEIFDFKVFRDRPWPLEVTWGQKYFHHSKAHTWLFI